ncbi:hypothetical protein HHK36_003196 [Tetracentron sinense]|uniref:Auxin-responsive protein n=1 Tax=Tetracentron sinense TaxID=13715 RepID=A0A834ZNB0_TETSI|nr:hypothetical protein HHK36_003196 [Tetracentron sinense]
MPTRNNDRYSLLFDKTPTARIHAPSESQPLIGLFSKQPKLLLPSSKWRVLSSAFSLRNEDYQIIVSATDPRNLFSLMSPPQLGVGDEGQNNVTLLASSASVDSICQNDSGLKERNYMGLSDCSSVDSSAISSLSEENKSSLNLKATELRLGLPGSQSPERDPELCLLSSAKLDEKPLFPLLPSKDGICLSSQKTVVLGNKRGFSDAMDGFSEVKSTVFTEGNWMFPLSGSDPETAQSVAQGKFPASSGINAMLPSKPSPNLGARSVSVKEHSGVQPAIMKEIAPPKVLQERPRAGNEANHNHMSAANNNSSAPAAKAQVVGWPPIRSFRKNTLAITSRNNDEVDGKPGPGALFIKVSMDGAPYLRKVDLRTYAAYQELSSALEKMFCCFTIGQCGSHGVPGREMLSESKLRDLLHGSEYVLSYEDKDGDWMLVGDVPWEMFIDSCKRMRIMKSSDAIGLAGGLGVKKWKRKGAWRGAYFPKFNVTVAYHRAVFLPNMKDGLKWNYRVDVDIPADDWADITKFYDFLIFNIGHWWGSNKFPKERPLVFYRQGKPILPPFEILDGLQSVLKSMVPYIHREVPSGTLKFWRLQSPGHFYSVEWNLNGSCLFNEPLEESQPDTWFDPRNKGVNKEARHVNRLIEETLRGTDIRLLNLTHLSEFRADAHPV